jgi:N-succinyldiaminopimelate aminotransferase
MPKFPNFSYRTKNLTGSIFEKHKPKMQQLGDDLVRLHIGDSYSTPPYHIPFDQEFLQATPGYSRYCDTYGIKPLRTVIADKLYEDNQLEVNEEMVLITCGATNALNISFQSLVNPGDDILALTPCWPFIKGMVSLAGGNLIEVPFYTNLYDHSELDIKKFLKSYLTNNTVALYLNTPNNPSGKVLNKSQLEQVADFVAQHDLWLISDEAYDGMTFDEHIHLSIGSFPKMLERTLSIFTFSKVFMFSGLRLGYVAAPKSVLDELNKIAVHQLYSPSTIAQHMMVEPVKNQNDWKLKFVRQAQELRDLFIGGLNISPPVPEGTYYLFFEITDYLNGGDVNTIIDKCLDAGVSVAPGNDFGTHYRDYIRICFTGEPVDKLKISIERLNNIFE